MNLEEINYDYYKVMPSYVKIVMELASEVTSPMEEYVVKEIFNSIVKNYSSDAIKEMSVASAFFENGLYRISPIKRINVANELYLTYIKQMFYCYQNGDFDMVKALFDSMYTKIKDTSGFRGIYKEEDSFTKMLNTKRNAR